MANGLLTSLTRFLGELPTNSVLRERATFLKEQAEAMEKRIAQLEQENAELRERLRDYEETDAETALGEEYVEHRGALFKRKPEGGYQRVVFCPICHNSTSSLQQLMPYHCAPCRWSADFTGLELDRVMAELV